MTEQEFLRLSTFIEGRFGIKLPGQKKTLLQARLRKRLKALSLPSYAEYIKYLFSKEGLETELEELIDVVSTNKTDFFREKRHFDLLKSEFLSEILKQKKSGQSLKVWSAGCSTGQEPWSLAMLLADVLANSWPPSFTIDATDVAHTVLETAANAVYSMDKLKDIPEAYRKAFLLKSRDSSRKLFRIAPEIRKKVRFKSLNLMDPFNQMENDYDLIFCRNTLIYFDRPVQKQIALKLISRLRPGGYLFIGHSESFINMDIPVEHVMPTIYRKKM